VDTALIEKIDVPAEARYYSINKKRKFDYLVIKVQNHALQKNSRSSVISGSRQEIG